MPDFDHVALHCTAFAASFSKAWSQSCSGDLWLRLVGAESEGLAKLAVGLSGDDMTKLAQELAECYQSGQCIWLHVAAYGCM